MRAVLSGMDTVTLSEVARLLPELLSERSDIRQPKPLTEQGQRQLFFPSVREYSRLFGLTRPRADRLPEHALVMHPGPMNRGVEIASDVADGPWSVILDQVTNGVAVRMAVLYLLGGAHGQE